MLRFQNVKPPEFGLHMTSTLMWPQFLDAVDESRREYGKGFFFSLLAENLSIS